jgi:type VI secretion system protein ImpM
LNTTNSVGFFGKLPAHGDFIYRGLPTGFINLWDEWLQGFVKCSQDQLGEAWLDIYLTSPIWRFAFSEGVIDQHAWMGIVLPSVDRVGRYFPFSVAARVSSEQNPFDMVAQSQWFETIEALALKALDGQINIDELIQDINSVALDQAMVYSCGVANAPQHGAIIAMDFDEHSPRSAIAPLFHAALKHTLSSYSVWTTQGSEFVAPCLFYCAGLPSLQNLAAMLDGQWDARGWSQPCHLTNV